MQIRFSILFTMSAKASTITISEANYLPPLLDDEVNRSINKTANDTVVSKVFSLVLDWGCPKEGSQSYCDFLENKTHKGKWIKYYDKLSDRERINLNEIDSSKFDVSYMLVLIPQVCPGLAERGSKVWQEGDQAKLECLLTKAKNLRNEDSHDPTGAALSPYTLSDVTKVAEKIIRKAGEMYRSCEPRVVQEEIDDLYRRIDKIQMSVMTTEEIKRKEIGDKICMEAKKDLEETVMKEEADKILFSQDHVRRRDVFHQIKLSIKDGQKENTIQIPCKELLNHLKKSYIIVTGMPGSGKSTLLRMIREDFMKPAIFQGLSAYDLLLYIQCRDTEETIVQLLKKNFPNAMDNVNDEAEAVYSLRKYKTLICVDGLDEITFQSNKLLNELIDMFGAYGNASFLFTGRFGASNTLKSNLGSKGLMYLDASVEPLYFEGEQVRFLKRYWLKIAEMTNSSKLVSCFRALGVPCRKCMIHPVYLSLFCHLFRRSPYAVERLESEWDIMELILKYSKDSIGERLLEEGITNEKERIDLVAKLVAALCNLTVRQLLDDSLTIDERTYRNLCQYVFGKHDVSHDRVLSSILVGQANHRFFEYLHKSNAEFLAASSILTRLDNGDVHSMLGCINEVAEEYTAVIRHHMSRQQRGPAAKVVADAHTKTEAGTVAPNEEDTKIGARFANVFRFIFMKLVQEDNDAAVEQYLQQVCLILSKANLPLEYWFELTSSCSKSKTVAKVAAEKAAEASSWTVSSPRHMEAATLMLPHHQPSGLTIQSPLSWGSPTALTRLLEVVSKWFDGELCLTLEHSYEDWCPADQYLVRLGSAQCWLSLFTGCLGSKKEAWRAFLDAAKRTQFWVNINVGLLHPRQHQLAELATVEHHLVVKVRVTDEDSGFSCPLPMGWRHPPDLEVHCQGGAKEGAVAALIEDLTPKDRRYRRLCLVGFGGPGDAVERIVDKLFASGVRTYGHGAPRGRPPSTNGTKQCEACGDSANHPEDKGRCVVLELPAHRTVTTHEEMSQLALKLPLCPLDTLIVEPPRCGGSPPALVPLLEAVAQHHSGELKLLLNHSYWDFSHADQLLQLLTSAKCRLTAFRGCLSGSSAAWEALAKMDGGEAVELWVSLGDPEHHRLDLLQPALRLLVLRARLTAGPNPRARCLPPTMVGSHILSLVCSPDTREQEAAQMIIDLAPVKMRYLSLRLECWRGSDCQLQHLMSTLVAVDLQAFTNTQSFALAGVNEEGRCSLCEGGVHPPDEGRCVELFY